MLHVSDNFSQAILADTRDMPYRVTLNGSIVMDQKQIPNMTLNESMGSSSGVTLGSANAAELTLTLRDPAITRYNGMLVEPESGIVLPDGSIEWVPLGKFWVTNTSTSNDYRTVKLSCADGMYNMSGEYESKLSYPASVKDFVHEIVEGTGVSFIEPESWPDIQIRLKPEKMTYRNAIGHAAGCCGWNARFNRNGDLEFVWYKDSGITIERNTQYMDGMTKLNDRPLDVNFQVVGEKERYKVIVHTDGFGSVYAIPSNGILEGDTVTLSVRPNIGYELVSISARSAYGKLNLYADAEGAGYTFVQPDCDVTITAQFNPEEAEAFKIETSVNQDDAFPFFTTGYVVVNTDEFNKTDDGLYRAGSKIHVRFARSAGYRFSGYESNVDMTYIDEDDFEFIMPNHDVTIAATFVWEDDEEKISTHSWLQYPVAPPKQKPFWAVLYKYDPNVSVPRRFHLVWFDSWEVSERVDNHFSKNIRKVGFVGYYRCYSQDDDNGVQYWDSSAWLGNGTGYEELSVHIDGLYTNIIYNWEVAPYCLVASNIPLFYGDGSLCAKASSLAIQEPQTSYIVDGMDIREPGVYSLLRCPDTYFTPPLASNWMIVSVGDAHDHIIMKFNEETGDYESIDDEFYSFNKPWVVFFDDVEIENIGTPFIGTDEEFYVAKLTNGHVVCASEYYAGTPGNTKAIPDGCVIGLRHPKNGIDAIFNLGGTRVFCGIYATTATLQTDTELLMLKNDCKVCDCAPAVNTFSLRSRQTAEPVTLVYTNPLICEKMVPSIQEVVQGITYTPARLKHRGNPAFQAGDIVTVPDGDGVYHTVLIQQQTMTFGGGMNSEISCPGQTADTANFNANSPVSTQIKQEVDQSRAEIEYQIAVNNAAIYAAVYSALGEANASLNTQMENATESIIEHDGKIEKLEEGLLGMEYNVGYIEQDVTDLKDRVDTLDEEMAAVQADIDEIKQQGSSQAGIKRTLLAQWGSLKYDYTYSDIENYAALDWVAEEAYDVALKKYKLFQIDILSEKQIFDGNGFTSFVVGNPALEDYLSHEEMHFYHMVKPGLYACVGAGATKSYKWTFGITVYDGEGNLATLPKAVGVAVYGIE